MPTTITRYPAADGGAIVPDLVEGFAADRIGGNVVQLIPGAVYPQVTGRAAGSRTGTLTFRFTSRAAALAAEAAHAGVGQFTLVDTDVPELGMVYVVTGGGRVHLELSESRATWLLDVDFTQVG